MNPGFSFPIVVCAADCATLKDELNGTLPNWKMSCNYEINGGEIELAGNDTWRVGNMSECAMKCYDRSDKVTNCSYLIKVQACCQAFVYRPYAQEGPNCFLKWQPAWKTIQPSGAGTSDCPTSVVGAYYPEGCHSCSQVQETLRKANVTGDENIREWNLSCNVDIKGHDLGTLPGAGTLDIGLVKEIDKCAELCMKRACQKGDKMIMSCCQAFTFIYDKQASQNCFLKGGMMTSAETSWANNWHETPGCVMTASVWRPNMSLCDLDQGCSQASQDAEDAKTDAIKSMGLSAGALGMAVVATILGLVPSIQFCIEKCRWPDWPWRCKEACCCCCSDGTCDPWHSMRDDHYYRETALPTVTVQHILAHREQLQGQQRLIKSCLVQCAELEHNIWMPVERVRTKFPAVFNAYTASVAI
jgi:hypothetical protein